MFLPTKLKPGHGSSVIIVVTSGEAIRDGLVGLGT